MKWSKNLLEEFEMTVVLITGCRRVGCELLFKLLPVADTDRDSGISNARF
jgi:hypothetical protein